MNATTRATLAITASPEYKTPGMEKYREAHAAQPVGVCADPTIRRMERADTTWMEARISDTSFHYSEVTEEAYRWMCRGCGLVWEKRHQARNCASRGHRTSYLDGPYGIRGYENGKPIGNPVYYSRDSVRREPVENR